MLQIYYSGLLLVVLLALITFVYFRRQGFIFNYILIDLVMARRKSQWCSAINCTNDRIKRKGLSFFRFPRDAERCKRWVLNSRREDLMKKTPDQLYKSNVLCSMHFEDSQFTNSSKTRLKPCKAIPTLFNVSNPLSTLEAKRKAPKERFVQEAISSGAKDTTEAIASHSALDEGKNLSPATRTENYCGCSCQVKPGKPGVNIETDIKSEPSSKRPRKENTTTAEDSESASKMLTVPNTSSTNLDVPSIKNEPPDSEEWEASREEDVTVKVEVAEDELKREEWIPAEMEDKIEEDNGLDNKNSDIPFYHIDKRIIGETSKKQLETMNHSQLCMLIAVMSREIVRLQAKLSNDKLTQRDIESPPDSDFKVIHNSFPVGMEVIDSGTQNTVLKSGKLELHPSNANEKAQESNESQPCNSVNTISNIPKSGTTGQKKAPHLQDKINIYALACGHVCSVCNAKDTLTRLEGSYTSVLPKVILIPTHSNESVRLNEEPECSLEMTAENVSDDFNIVERTNERVDILGTENHITSPMFKSVDQRQAEQNLCETSLDNHETSDIPSTYRDRETEKLPPSLLLNQVIVGMNNSSSSRISELQRDKSYDPLYY